MLNYIEYGEKTDAPSLLIVHGLYGSGRNWGAVAKRLAKDRHVVSVDQRNHGASPWKGTNSYPDMADDLAAFIEAQGGRWDVLGHSMGGKAAMVLALTRPEAVNRLIVGDIAPVSYGHSQLPFIHAMRAVDLERVSKRSDAVEQLAETVENPSLRTFFTQSLDVVEKKWKLNLDVLEREMPLIMGFPEIEGRYEGQVLFLSGGLSDYVLPEHRDKIRGFFPKAAFVKITGAGHWLHAEKPREFVVSVAAWLNRDV